MERPHINALSHRCKEGFAALLAAVTQQHSEDLVDSRDVARLQERFDQWAGNLGALQQPSSPLSLEHRLRDAVLVSHYISDVLKSLCDSLHAATDIATGERHNRISDALIVNEDMNLPEYDISSSESSNSGSEESAPLSVSEIEALVVAIKQSVDSLFKASIFVRKFGPKDRRLRAAERTSPFDSQYDIMYVIDKYPILEGNHAVLAKRLGEANARRRQYFKYRRDHNDRLTTVRIENNGDVSRPILSQGFQKDIQDEEPERSEMTRPSLLADTAATPCLFEESGMMQHFQLQDPQHAISVASFATHVDETTDAELPFPAMPLEAQEGTPFLCPYCISFVQLKFEDAEHQWRKHVIRDLEPYICTHASCTLDTFSSQNAWFEHELLMHRSRWTCPRCPSYFETPGRLRTHLEQKHQDSFSDRQISTVVESSKRLSEHVASKECPFCDGSWASLEAQSSYSESGDTVLVSIKQYQQHLGRHLQQIALFALPRIDHIPDGSAASRLVLGVPDVESMSKSHSSRPFVANHAAETPNVPESENQNRGLRLLSLDGGGGVRGSAALMILKELMMRVKTENHLSDEPLPSDYFDLIGGTGAGGIIAILLGRLRLSATAAIAKYLELSQNVFSDGMFTATSLDGVIKGVVTAVLGKDREDASMYEEDEVRCRTFVCAAPSSGSTTGPTLLRSYKVKANASDECTIWQAARASFEAPAFSKPIMIDPSGAETDYVGGKTTYSNPTEIVIEEAVRLFPPETPINCIVSIGTGRSGVGSYRKPAALEYKLSLELPNTSGSITTAENVVASKVASRFQESPDTYFRLNNEYELQNVSLTERNRSDHLHLSTKYYMESAEMKRHVEVLTGILAGSVAGHGYTIRSFDELPGADRLPHHQFYNNLKSIVEDYVPRLSYETRLSSWLDTAPSQFLVLYGMNGSGKTQLAIKCCHKAKAKGFRAVFWLDASSIPSLKKSYRDIAAQIINPRPHGSDEHVNVQVVLDFCKQTSGPWLLVFDNCEDAHLLEEDLSAITSDTQSQGRILITTHRNNVKDFGIEESIDAGMTEEEGIELLLHQHPTELSTSIRSEANKIVSRLGYLPFALHQAGVYIRQQKLQLQEFQQHYEARKRSILEVGAESWQVVQGGRQLVRLSGSGSASWESSLRIIGSTAEENAQIMFFLAMASYFDTEKISERYFRAAVTRTFRRGTTAGFWMNPFWCEDGWDAFSYRNVLSQLRAQALIRTLVEQDNEVVFSLHPVMADWIKVRQSTFSASEIHTQAALTLGAYLERRPSPCDVSELAASETMSHIKLIVPNLGLIPFSLTDSDRVCLGYLLQYLGDLSMLGLEVQLRENILKYEEVLYGTEDRRTIVTLLQLGWACNHADLHEKSEQYFQRATNIRQQQLVHGHHSTFEARRGSLESQETLLRLEEKAYGTNSLMALNVEMDLAKMQLECCEYEQARASCERVIMSLMHPDFLKAPDDPNPLQEGFRLFVLALECLDSAYQEQAYWATSEEVNEQLLSLYRGQSEPNCLARFSISLAKARDMRAKDPERKVQFEEEVRNDESSLRIFREWLRKPLIDAQAQPWFTEGWGSMHMDAKPAEQQLESGESKRKG